MQSLPPPSEPLFYTRPRLQPLGPSGRDPNPSGWRVPYPCSLWPGIEMKCCRPAQSRPVRTRKRSFAVSCSNDAFPCICSVRMPRTISREEESWSFGMLPRLGTARRRWQDAWRARLLLVNRTVNTSPLCRADENHYSSKYTDHDAWRRAAWSVQERSRFNRRS